MISKELFYKWIHVSTISGILSIYCITLNKNERLKDLSNLTFNYLHDLTPMFNFFSWTQVEGLEKSCLIFKPKNKEVFLILASVILDQPCPKMDFAKFPLDTQTCSIAIGGLRVRSSEIKFILLRIKILLKREAQLSMK